CVTRAGELISRKFRRSIFEGCRTPQEIASGIYSVFHNPSPHYSRNWQQSYLLLQIHMDKTGRSMETLLVSRRRNRSTNKFDCFVVLVSATRKIKEIHSLVAIGKCVFAVRCPQMCLRRPSQIVTRRFDDRYLWRWPKM